jgi:hypothetical protein
MRKKDRYEDGYDGYCSEESNQVRALDENEAVAICYGRDGISDDCFFVNAGLLVSEGFGHLHYESDEQSPTVWVSPSKFHAINAACG